MNPRVCRAPWPTDKGGLCRLCSGHPLEHDGIVGAAGLDDTAAARNLQRDTTAALDLRELRHPEEHTAAGAGGNLLRVIAGLGSAHGYRPAK